MIIISINCECKPGIIKINYFLNYDCPWGTKECSVTTIDGSIIRFFETT